MITKTITAKQAAKLVSLLQQTITKRELTEGVTYINQQQAEEINFQMRDIYSDIK